MEVIEACDGEADGFDSSARPAEQCQVHKHTSSDCAMLNEGEHKLQDLDKEMSSQRTPSVQFVASVSSSTFFSSV